MWRQVAREVGEQARWAQRHPFAAGVVAVSWLSGLAYIFLLVRPAFNDVNDFQLISWRGSVVIAESAAAPLGIRRAGGEIEWVWCQRTRGRRGPTIQYCLEEAVAAGLRDGERVTVNYLRPPNRWEEPVLLSIRSETRTYLACPAQLARIGLRATRYAALCD